LPDKKKILFLSTFDTPFIQDDYDFLKKHFIVKKITGKGLTHIFKIFFFGFNSYVIYCWFASVYSFFAVVTGKLFGAKSVVVVGGVDVAKEEKYGYGIWLSFWKSKLVRFSLRYANKILVVDPSLGEDAKRLAEYDGKNIMYLPTAYDSSFWKPLGVKDQMVLTVAVIRDQPRLLCKGIEILIEVARMLSNIKFIVIGVDENIVLKLRPPLNIVFLSAMTRKELLPFYQQAKVYCLPSRREGLPNTLCEAMLCHCIPVATNIGGVRTAVGDSGILVEPDNSSALAEAVKEALKFPDETGMKGRARIVSLFPKEKRENGLLQIISELTK
jgi:glycosyltransferase involved in cell wall biosynthesis